MDLKLSEMNVSDIKKKSKPFSLTNIRLDFKLQNPDDPNFYNSLNYKSIAKSVVGDENVFDDDSNHTDWLKEYEEDSYIDNTELYPDSLPVGKTPDCGGFFVNSGKLKLKSIKGSAKKSAKKLSPKSLKPPKKKNKNVAKTDANAKLDCILKSVLKERMVTQDNPSVNEVAAGCFDAGYVAGKFAGSGSFDPASFVSPPKPRMKLTYDKVQRKI